MRFNHARGIRRMVLARFVLLAAVLLAASSVSAAVTIDLGPSDYKKFGPGASHVSNGIRSSFGQTVRMPPMNTNLAVTRNPVVPYGSIANGAKNFVRINPASAAASAAITALFLGLDWVFDDELDSWMKQDVEIASPEPGSIYWYNPIQGESVPYSTPVEACRVWEGPGTTPISARRQTDTLFACITPSGGQTGFVHRHGETCPTDYSYNNLTGTCERGVLIDLDASDWQRLENSLPSENPQLVSGAASDIMKRQGGPLPGYADTTITGPSSVAGPETTSTSTDPVTGDTVVTTTQTTTNISYGDTTITTTNTTTTNTYINGTHTSTETITETPGELPVSDSGGAPSAGEWPGFCDWATVVCDFIEWFKEPFEEPEVEWPEIVDEDFEEEFNFNLPSSCPAPYTINLSLFPSVQFDWQPFCDLATFIRPLVLASAAIFAAFITLGIARART